MEATIVRACRLDPALETESQRVLVAGRALRPADGFDALLTRPTWLHPYAAARAVHAVRRARDAAPPKDLYDVAYAYAGTTDFAHEPCRDRLVRLLKRAGLSDREAHAGAVTLVWTGHRPEALSVLFEGKRAVPYPSLAHAIAAECALLRAGGAEQSSV